MLKSLSKCQRAGAWVLGTTYSHCCCLRPSRSCPSAIHHFSIFVSLHILKGKVTVPCTSQPQIAPGETLESFQRGPSARPAPVSSPAKWRQQQRHCPPGPHWFSRHLEEPPGARPCRMRHQSHCSQLTGGHRGRRQTAKEAGAETETAGKASTGMQGESTFRATRDFLRQRQVMGQDGSLGTPAPSPPRSSPPPAPAGGSQAPGHLLTRGHQAERREEMVLPACSSCRPLPFPPLGVRFLSLHGIQPHGNNSWNRIEQYISLKKDKPSDCD